MIDQLLANRYRLIDLVATGGMGEVWRAKDEVLKRLVAVKLLQGQLATDPAATERFRREALTSAGLSHPNIAKVFDFIQEARRPGIVMELVDGETLATRLRREGALPAEQARLIAQAVLSALSVAHAAGIVHRDIKPGNILLTHDGSVKVTDFGIARAVSDARLTLTGAVMGTAHYAAPEQIRGSPATPSSDLYGLGCVLYEMLTGRRPFEADTSVAVAMARLTNDPEPPTRVRPGIPRSLEAVTMRALMRDPASRFADADEMRAALNGSTDELVHTGALPVLRPTSDPEPTSVLPVGGPTDVTVALRSTHTDGAPQTFDDGRTAIADALPPRWAARRAAKFLVPLFVVGALGAGLFAIAAGARTIEIPNFKGMQKAQAIDLATDRGIELDFRQTPSLRPRDEVIRQDSRAGLNVSAADAQVTLTLSTGVPPCCTVPDLTGMTKEQAKQALDDAQLGIGKTYSIETTEGSDGTVVDQNPRTGRWEPGTLVDITLAKAPPDEDDDEKGKGNGRRGGD